MRIAVAIFDDETIAGHFRHSDRFAVFDVTGGEVEALEVRQLTAAPLGHEHGSHNHNEALQLLADCCAVICGGMGTGIAEVLSRNGTEPVVAADSELSPAAAARQFANGTLQRGAIHACCCKH